jgi:cytochrome P450
LLSVSRDKDVRAAVKDAQTFLNFEGIDIDDTAKHQSGPGFLPDIDNPRHDELRRIVQPDFLRGRIATLEESVRQIVRTLTAGWRDRGEVDLAQELAWPLPYEVFFSLLGLPKEDYPQLITWSHELKDRLPNDPRLTPVAKAATAGLWSYFAQLLRERRAHPRRDLLTHMVTAHIGGKLFAEPEIDPESEIVRLTFVLFMAGIETTAGLVSAVFRALAEYPDQRALLREDPALIPSAVEEGLRFSTPLQVSCT